VKNRVAVVTACLQPVSKPPNQIIRMIDGMFVTTRDSEVTHAIRDGVIAVAPLVAGFAPFALVVGATLGAAANPGAGIAGSWIIYGGSAQIATARTLQSGGAATAVITALLINTRLLVYSASLSQHWREQPRWFRIAAAPMIVDPVWALAEARAARPGSAREIRAHYFGSAICLFVAWSVFIITGVALGSRLDSHALGVAAPLCLLWLVVSRLQDPRTRFIVAAAATGAFVGRNLPSGLAIFVAILAGCIAGQALDRHPLDRSES